MRASNSAPDDAPAPTSSPSPTPTRGTKGTKSRPSDVPITALTHPHHVFTHCELCGREQPLTFHHLLPKRTHRRARFQRRYSKYELNHRGLYLCRPCHDGIHDLIPDEVVLGERYNTKELLLAHEGIARHVAWVAKQK